MLTQFRNCYPRGGLISEFLTIDHGKYIVKVSVQVDGLVLATGLAAGDSVEEAEDKARKRALELLDLSVSESKIASDPVKVKVKENVMSPETPPLKQSPPQSTIHKAAELPVVEKIVSEVEEIIVEPELELSLVEDLNQDSLLVTVAPEESPEFITTEIEKSQESSPIKNQAKEPIDFSDVIAQTSVEMKRLGWTNDMGREYVLSTYGKRSRQVLTDEELLEFLEYLKSQ